MPDFEQYFQTRPEAPDATGAEFLVMHNGDVKRLLSTDLVQVVNETPRSATVAVTLKPATVSARAAFVASGTRTATVNTTLPAAIITASGTTASGTGFTDNFTDNVIGADWNTGSIAATVAETGGALSLTRATSGTAYIETAKRHNLVGAYLSVKVTSAGLSGADDWRARPFVLLPIAGDFNTYMQLVITNGPTVKVETSISGVVTTLGSMAYNSGTMVYFRVAEYAGSLTWSYSANGTTWTTWQTFASPFSMSNLLVAVAAGGNTQTVSHTMTLDDFTIATTTTFAADTMYWGALMDGADTYTFYYGGTWGAAPDDPNTWTRFEQNADKRVSLVHYGDAGPWGGVFNNARPDLIRARGAFPLLEMTSGSISLADIAAGVHDIPWASWATAVAAWGKPLMLMFDPRMNVPGGDSWAAQAATSPTTFVNAWRRLHDLAEQSGATNITWCWVPSVKSADTTSLAALYPGHGYVDWTGAVGFNAPALTTWTTFSTLFTATYTDLVALAPSKPLLIETASNVGTAANGGAKATWITDMFTTLSSSFPAARALVWFNWRNLDTATGTRQELAIESSATAIAAFKAGIANTRFKNGQYSAVTGKVVPAGSSDSGATGAPG